MKNKNGIDKALIICMLVALIFTITMIILFCIFQAVPDTLIVSVFGALFGELGFCTILYRTKTKNKMEVNDGDHIE